MPEFLDHRQVFSLLEVTQSIGDILAERFSGAFWVRAELLKLNHYPKSGHCYPDLVEKVKGTVVAQMRAHLWRNAYEETNRRFVEITREPLKDGINILFFARISFHPVYGLALNILEIDPNYTLGVMAREKLETIRKLKENRIFDNNKRLIFPLLPKRIAVISVETSKGFSDFRKKIDENPFGYRFFYMLFPSLLQGDKAVNQLIRQLRRIRKIQDHFDVVAIIRGGGGDVGLNCYDNYRLAREVALFPLPVMTGIGHSTNETVVQMVAHTNNITPTDLADFLIQKFHNFTVPLREYSNAIFNFASGRLLSEKERVSETARYFRTVSLNSIDRNHSFLVRSARELYHHSVAMCTFGVSELKQRSTLLSLHTRSLIRGHNRMLKVSEKQLKAMDPENVLKRGFSITSLNGKVLKDPGILAGGETIVTRLSDGSITSIVESTSKKKWKKKSHTGKPLKSSKQS